MDIPGASFRAGANIIVCGAVIVDPAADNQVIMCTGLAHGLPIGIAQEGMNAAPGVAGSNSVLAATSGQNVKIAGVGNVALVQLNGTATRGQLAEVSNASGYVENCTGTGARYCIGQFLMSGVSGEWVDVWVQPIFKYS